LGLANALKFAKVGDKEMSEEILRKLAAIEQRLENLERHERSEEELAVVDGTQKLDRDARFSALLAIVQQLAVREGVSKEHFAKHFHAQLDFQKDRLLRIVEDANQNWAGQIDERTEADQMAPDPPEPLFLPPNPDEEG